MKINRILLALLLAATTLTASAQRTLSVDLWADHAPSAKGQPGDTARIQVFLPDEHQATGRAVVICPGGGYEGLSMQKEGTDWAAWLNNMGIAAVVLKYRMPNGHPAVPIADAEEALRLVRANARAWNIDADDVGIMGFSAGGHLAATVATQARQDAKPNFQILFYPVITMISDYTHHGSHDNFLGQGAKKKQEQQYSADQHVTRLTPRALILLSDDDHTVMAANGVNYYAELYRHDVPASLHVYPSGGHGWGMQPTFRYHAEMLLELRAWLTSF